MEYEFIEFKAGQRWKTRMGKRFIIKEIREDEGFEVPGYPTDNDLVEQIS
jgi:hypothetical protein